MTLHGHLTRAPMYVLLLTVMGCDPRHEPGVLLQDAGPGIHPAAAGPYAVGVREDLPVRRLLLPGFELDLYYPTLPDLVVTGDAPPTAPLEQRVAPYPLVILVPDLLGNPNRLDWLGAQLASWGMVVAVPTYPLRTALLAPARPSVVLSWLEAGEAADAFWAGGIDYSSVAIGGLGAGAGVADLVKSSDGRIDAVFLLSGGAWGDPGGRSGPTFLLSGSPDCDGNAARAEQDFAQFTGPRALVQVQGLDPAQLETAATAAGPCAGRLTQASAHARVSEALVSFLVYYLEGDEDAETWLDPPSPGLSVRWDF